MQAMATIRSNLNSVSSTTHIAAIKKRWTTCLQNWHKNTANQQQRQPPRQEPQQQAQGNKYNYYTKYQQHQQQRHEQQQRHCFCQHQEYSFKEKTQEHLKHFKEKIKKLFSTKHQQRARRKSNKTTTTKTIQQEQVQIVAKLLSSTLIATATETTQTEAYEEIQQQFSAVNMTITEDTFQAVRDEYPDLDKEIRSILISRAQEGATISEIKDDYYKNTGLTFPSFEHVTEFLLTIPWVTAMCNERGTRIFNIVPSERTKHLHDLVVNQKPAQYNNNNRINHNNNNYNILKRSIAPYAQPNRSFFWRNNLNYKSQQLEDQQQHMLHKRPRLSDHNNNNNIECNSLCNKFKNIALQDKENIDVFPTGKHKGQIINNNNNNNVNGALQQRLRTIMDIAMPMPMQTEPDIICPTAVPAADKPLHSPTDSSEGFIENNWYYQDNCNYLYNRLCNQPNHLVTQQCHLVNYNNKKNLRQQEIPIDGNNNNNQNYDFKALLQQQNEQLSDYYQQQQQQHLLLQNNNNLQHMNSKNNKNYLAAEHAQHGRRISITPSSLTNETSLFTIDSDYEAHLLDFPLLGDDFFLYLARMELRCKFKKFQRVLQSGMCVSGQTISAATKRIRMMPIPRPERRVIVNIGSVDIMQGKPLVQIEHDLRELLDVMRRKGLIPILTTLAPLANYGHESHVKLKVERFNEYIKRKAQHLLVIDIWTCMVNERGQTLFGCFQSEPRNVTGAAEPYVFWNKIGRQRVLQLIESKLEY